MTQQAKWNGLPTTARQGTAVVADAPEFARYWAKEEGLIGQRIRVVEVDLNGVNYGGGVAYLDDRDGSGSSKVFDADGSPRVGHRDVEIVPGSFTADLTAEELETIRRFGFDRPPSPDELGAGAREPLDLDQLEWRAHAAHHPWYRSDVPALVAEVRRLREVVEHLRAGGSVAPPLASGTGAS